MNSVSATPHKDRIGLALSGGGFRASLFHLGVIRRLEELGIMEHVSIVSAVSGGSIVAAFYLCEMEKQLRESRVKKISTPPDRVLLFEKIAEKFLKAVDNNLRSRALIFTPFYHPILFVKTLFSQVFRKGARAELIQAEYDKFFFFGDTMDQLPVERPEKAPPGPDNHLCVEHKDPYYGPRLLLNATSLLSGERVSFSRDASSGINDLKTPDRNVIPLSRVVGASSGVPVLFPPTAILGDLLVDGGISDNQGIEGLLDPENHCNIILVSDASGQLQVQHTLSTSEISVYGRTNEILQFQVRNKLLKLLCKWGEEDTDHRRFAFVHLLINLKSRKGRPPRVSTSILPALGRIRTDLDQFSPIECEALMYHGYSLIDAQLKHYCCDFLQRTTPNNDPQKKVKTPPLKTPPLFRINVQKKILDKIKKYEESPDSFRKDQEAGSESLPQSRTPSSGIKALNYILDKIRKIKIFRDPIRKDLEAGSQNIYMLRCLKKHAFLTLIVHFMGIAAYFLLVRRFYEPLRRVVEFTTSILKSILNGIVPSQFVDILDRILDFFDYKNFRFAAAVESVSYFLALILVFAIAVYLAYFPIYEVVRWVAMWRDRNNYKKITAGIDFSVHSWQVDPD
jgi:predicted acylesterase/phospholipase RssA